METSNLLLTIVGFLVVVYLLSYFFTGKKALSNFANANTELVIPATSLPPGTSVNFTYSIWIYIDDWSYRYGQEKVIFSRGSTTGFMPALSLSPTENDLHITTSITDGQPFETVVPNIPIQQWTNLIVSLNTRTLDVYVNGKLVRTNVLPGMPKLDPNAALNLTPRGGFSGYTSRFNYWNDTINPQEAWNIYKAGPGGTWFSGFVNQYKIQFNFLQGNDVKASLTI
jgi:hypothetical protein